MVRLRECVALTAFMLTAAVGAQSPVPPASPKRFVAASIKPFESGAQRDFGVGNGDVPGFDTALRESLGLKLQSARGMVDVLVIDSVERPTPN